MSVKEIAEARQALRALYLEVPEEVARSVAARVDGAFDALRTRRDELDTECAALRTQIGHWRSWVPFVFMQGGPPTLDDDGLRAAICKAFDDEVARIKTESEATVTALVSAHSWQPIETAPKDGTCILAFGIHTHSPRDAQRGVKVGDHWWAMLVWDVWRGDPADGWGDSSRWVFSKDGAPAWSFPTHWMPLPEPPIDAPQARHAGARESETKKE